MSIRDTKANHKFMSFKNLSKEARWSCIDFTSNEIISKMYIEVTSIIRPSKLHQKITSKKRGNSSILTCRHNFETDSTCWVCWHNRTKLGLVSTQNHRCFNSKFWRSLKVSEVSQSSFWGMYYMQNLIGFLQSLWGITPFRQVLNYSY